LSYDLYFFPYMTSPSFPLATTISFFLKGPEYPSKCLLATTQKQGTDGIISSMSWLKALGTRGHHRRSTSAELGMQVDDEFLLAPRPPRNNRVRDSVLCLPAAVRQQCVSLYVPTCGKDAVCVTPCSWQCMDTFACFAIASAAYKASLDYECVVVGVGYAAITCRRHTNLSSLVSRHFSVHVLSW
jgi:hypothetical protein